MRVSRTTATNRRILLQNLLEVVEEVLVEDGVLSVVSFYERRVEACNLFRLRWEVNRLSCGTSIVSSEVPPMPFGTYLYTSS